MKFLQHGVERSAHFFVLSFSADGDDLDQWRAYADNGRGYALGFDGKMLEDAFIKRNGNPIPNNSTYHVTYDENVLADIHRRIIDKMFHLIRDRTPGKLAKTFSFCARGLRHRSQRREPSAPKRP